MSTITFRSSDAASARMLALSACIHGICILALIAVAGSFHKPKPQQEEAITRVHLEAPPASPPKTEIMQPEIVTEPEPPAENTVQVVEQAKPEDKKHAEIVTKVEKPAEQSIPVKKRKKRMKEVKAPKPPEKKPEKKAEAKPDKKRTEPPKKKETPDEILAKRFAELRKEVAHKKSDAGGQPRKPSPTVPGDGVRPGSGVVDRQFLEWYAGMRDKIDANWRVFASYRNTERATVVGVQLADDGRLINATLDQTSGDEVLDRAALRAVYQASPFPRVPAEVAEKIRQAGGLALKFSVKGMQ